MQKQRITRLFTFVLFILLLPSIGCGQKWVADTILVKIPPQNAASSVGITVLDVQDFRNLDSKTISLFEKKKWLFFPVNQVVVLPDSLSTCIKNYFSIAHGDVNYSIDFYRFHISNYKAGNKRNFKLVASAELYTNKKLVGSVYYELPFMQKRKAAIETGYGQTLYLWAESFNRDLINISHNVDELVPGQLNNFRREQKVIQQNFYVSSDVFVGSEFWGLDAEIWFSPPESAKRFQRKARIVRYYHHSNLQTIAFGKSVNHWNWRINENWLFSNKASFLLGINNWTDLKTEPHKLEEILRFDLSATQKMTYNKLDKTGFVLGAGLMEDFYYIIYHRPKFKVAGVLNVTYKF